MVKFINAKLNLGLNIVRKREDGYHELLTAFYPVGKFNGTPENPEPFCDILDIHTTGYNTGDRFRFSGNNIGCQPSDNLATRAMDIFRSTCEEESIACMGIDLELYKHIPDGAGLGGGSADASFALLAANQLHGYPFPKEKLLEMAARLGADCPFFIENRPVTARGIGEIMRPIEPVLEGYWALIVKPDVYVSTREAFAGITPREPERQIEDILRLPVRKWEEEGLRNDFEPHIFDLHPLLADIKEELKGHGALYAAMSGSGSALFGIFSTRGDALEGRKAFGQPLKTYVCKL